MHVVAARARDILVLLGLGHIVRVHRFAVIVSQKRQIRRLGRHLRKGVARLARRRINLGLAQLGRHLVVRHIHIAVGRLKPCGVGVTAHAVQIAVTRRNFATCVGHGSALGLVTGGTIALRRPGEGRRAFGRIRQRVSAVVAYAVGRAGRKSRGEQQRCKHSKASSYMHRYRFLVFKRQWGRLQTSPRNFRDSSGSRRPYSLRRLRHCSQCCLHR